MAAVEEVFPDRIAQTFVGKTVLITGGTGFIGKVLIERILSVCPDVKEILLLIRSKRDKDHKQRLEDVFKKVMFDKLRTKYNSRLSRVKSIASDMTAPNLGLSERDREICRTAHIIINSAASVKFNEKLKAAVTKNVYPTISILNLAKECKNLELLLHVSTAYCHPEHKVLEERFYAPPASPEYIMKLCASMSDEEIIDMTPKLLGIYPNTYVYTKALAEALIEDAIGTLPVAVCRPSIVVPAMRDPLPGWMDNLNGPSGLLTAAGKGVMRTMWGDPEIVSDFIPVDMVVNLMMLQTWDYIVNGNHDPVMNLAASDEVKIKWREVIDIPKSHVLSDKPFDNTLWIPTGGITKNYYEHQLRSLILEWIPAYLVDLLLYCLGYKPLLVNIHKKIKTSSAMLEFYTNNTWDFICKRHRNLYKTLTKEEQEIYLTFNSDTNVVDYFGKCVLGTRRYILKEKDENLPRAIMEMTIKKYIHIVLRTCFYGYLFYWSFLKFVSIVNMALLY